MKNKKTIWIVNQDATTPHVGYAGRSYYLADELSQLGHQVYLIAGSFSHLHFKATGVTESVEIRNEAGFKMVWVNVPKYSQAHSKKRILNWFLFGYKLTALLKRIKDSPDIIYYSSPPLIGFLGAYRLKKRTNARLIFEFRDIWPMTLKEIGGYGENNPMIKFMSWIENFAYQKSDYIISNLSNAFEYLKKFNIEKKKFLWIPNGVSLQELKKNIPLNPEIDLKIPKNKFIIGYSGTLGVSNALEHLMEASIELKSQRDILFVVVGTGKEKEKLKKMVEGNSNVLFLDAVPKIEVHALLQRFDVCYLGWKRHEIYNYGIGSNKMPEYLMSGNPILHSYSGACDPITSTEAGLTIEAENTKEIVKNILILKEMNSKTRADLRNKSKLFAKKYYRYDILAKKIQELLLF